MNSDAFSIVNQLPVHRRKKRSKLQRLSKGFTGYREVSQGLYVACDLQFAVIQSVHMPGNKATDVNKIYFWICCIVLLITKQHDKFKQGSSSVLNQEQWIPNCQFGEEIFVSLIKDYFLFCLEKKSPPIERVYVDFTFWRYLIYQPHSLLFITTVYLLFLSPHHGHQ